LGKGTSCCAERRRRRARLARRRHRDCYQERTPHLDRHLDQDSDLDVTLPTTTTAVSSTWAHYSVCLYWQSPASARSVLPLRPTQRPSLLRILTPGTQIATAAASCCGAATCSAVCSMCGKCNNSKKTCARPFQQKTSAHAQSSRHRNPHRICPHPPPQLHPLMADHDRLGRQEASGCPS